MRVYVELSVMSLDLGNSLHVTVLIKSNELIKENIMIGEVILYMNHHSQ